MKTEIEWAELHAPLFLAGTNLGQKLDPTKRAGLKMLYDEDKRHLYVSYNGRTGRIPETSVLSMVEVEPSQSLKERVESFDSRVAAERAEMKAQVSTPMDHVHAGPGHGDTGQPKPTRGNRMPKV